MTKRAACAVVDLTTSDATSTRKKARSSALEEAPFAWQYHPGNLSPTHLIRDSSVWFAGNSLLPAPPLDEQDAKPAAIPKKESPAIHIIDFDDSEEEEEEEKYHRESHSELCPVTLDIFESKQPPGNDTSLQGRRNEAFKRLPEDDDERKQHAAWWKAAPVATSAVASMPPKESFEEETVTTSDEALAQCLQEEWNEQESSRKALEEAQTKESVTGKALELVQGVLQIQEELVQEFPQTFGKLNCVARDDMVFMAEATLQERLNMKAAGKPVAMDVGYHFTRPQNMVHIRTGGLLTQQDRTARGIEVHFNGSAMGDGIYTANDTSYGGGGRYGDTGLLVARLKGVESVPSRGKSFPHDISHDTYVHGNIVVLRKSSQCLALLEFDRSLLQDPATARAIWAAHVKLQKLLDQCLNGSHHAIAPPLTEPARLLQDAMPQMTELPSSRELMKKQRDDLREKRDKQRQQRRDKQLQQQLQHHHQRSQQKVQQQDHQDQQRAQLRKQIAQIQKGIPQMSQLEMLVMQRAQPPSPLEMAQQRDQTKKQRELMKKQRDHLREKRRKQREQRREQPQTRFEQLQQQLQHRHQRIPQKVQPSQQLFQQLAQQQQQQVQQDHQYQQLFQQLVHQQHPATHQQMGILGASHQEVASTGSSVVSTSQLWGSLSPLYPGNNTSTTSSAPSQFQDFFGSAHISQSFATHRPSQSPVSADIVSYTAPDSLDIDHSDDVFAATVPCQHYGTECSICLCEMKSKGQQEVTCLAKCGHAFHFGCISQALRKQRQCPNCRAVLGTPRGKMPSGSMRVTFDSRMTCSSHAPGTICIYYSIYGGIQKEYHDNPGVRFGSSSRQAYLPDCVQGRDLLKRLKYAFGHGLSFTVGTSLTTHQPNTVTWSSVHHKTSTGFGAHGFPDPNYFSNCNSELDQLGVPAAKDLS